jgi:outer membrane lipoprotein-sorting protein
MRKRMGFFEALGLSAGLLSSWLATAGSPSDTPWGLTDLGRALAAVTASTAEFTETKYIYVLDEPLKLEGVLLYRAPDHVRKVVSSPYPESYEASGEKLTIENPDAGRRTVSLDEHPQVRAFVEAFRATLAGDFTRLQQYYAVELEGGASRWTLRLTPLPEQISAYVSKITIRGHGPVITKVETLEKNGDLAVMDVRPISE